MKIIFLAPLLMPHLAFAFLLLALQLLPPLAFALTFFELALPSFAVSRDLGSAVEFTLSPVLKTGLS